MPIYEHLKVYRPTTQIEFMPKGKSKDVVGTVIDYEVRGNEFHTHVVYSVRTEDGELHCVDGELYRGL